MAGNLARLVFFGLSFWAVYFLQPFLTQAGQVLLPRTGQTQCWDSEGDPVACPGTGQDGEMGTGVDWSSPRFVPADQGEAVLDALTGLVWLKDANIIKTRNPELDNDGAPGDGCVTWQNSLAYVIRLNQDKYLGYDDWRLPNIRELRSLIHYGESSPAVWLNADGQGFADVQNGYYWSSTTAALSLTQAWAASFRIGDLTVKDKTDNLYVWPVRAGRSRIEP